MTKNRRTRTPSADIRAAILDAAADLLEKEGPDALSVRRIATAAGVAPMGVYNHFESKAGIVEALFVQGFERLAEALDAIADIEDPYEALREGGRRYRALALAHPMVYQVMFLRAVRVRQHRNHAGIAVGHDVSLLARPAPTGRTHPPVYPMRSHRASLRSRPLLVQASRHTVRPGPGRLVAADLVFEVPERSDVPDP